MARPHILARRIGRRLDRQEGVVAVMVTLLLIVIFAAVAFAIDLSRLRHERHVVQTAVDFGALAAAGLLPAEGGLQADAVVDMAVQIALQNAPDITAADVTVSFRCVVQDPEGDGGQNSPDLEFACNEAGGGPFDDGQWKVRGKRAFHACDPYVGDKCNAVVVRAANTIQYFFAPVIGFDQGDTGSVAGAACKGFCGQPNKPLDIVLILDRTTSMTATDVAAAKDGARAVLAAYDPALHKVGLILVPYAYPGPPETASSALQCQVAPNQFYPAGSQTPYSWRPANPAGITPIAGVPRPQWEPPEQTFYGGNDWNSSPWGVAGLTSDYTHLGNLIDCFQQPGNSLNGNPDGNSAVWVDNPGFPVNWQARGGGHTNYSDPMWAARNMLARSDPEVPDVIIFMGDGQANQPNDGTSGGSPLVNPCQRSVTAAGDAKAAEAAIYTIAYGVGTERCAQDDVSGGYVDAYATSMFADMATDPSDDNQPGGCATDENLDQDYYYCTPDPAELDDVFAQVAVDTLQRARLIQFD